MPDEIQPKLSQVINAISEKPELDNYFSTVIRNIYDLAPPYTYFHYRLLHKEVQNSAKTHYIGNMGAAPSGTAAILLDRSRKGFLTSRAAEMRLFQNVPVSTH